MKADTHPIEAFYKLQLRRLRKWLAVAAVTKPQGRRWGSALPVRAAWQIHNGQFSYEYRGLPMLKNPFDFALYQMLFFRLKPATVIEIGSHLGASALWFSDMMKTNERPGRVISIDVTPPSPPYQRPEISFLKGDAHRLGDVLTPALMDGIQRPLLVIEDSLHTPAASLAVMRFFDDYLRTDEYIVVEDGVVTDLGVAHHHDGGPGPAIAQFLLETGDRYAIDTDYCDRFGHNVTANPNGYLRRL